METPNPTKWRPRWIRAMRPLLVLALLIIGATAYAADNKVTLEVSKSSLESVLHAIEKQTDYRFFYSKETINVKVRVSVKAKNETVQAVLDKILPEHGINYVIDGKRIALKHANTQSQPSGKTETKGNKAVVFGSVTDSKGEPLIGASITIEGHNTGVATDINGNYSIEVPLGCRLNFSYIGYTPP